MTPRTTSTFLEGENVKAGKIHSTLILQVNYQQIFMYLNNLFDLMLSVNRTQQDESIHSQNEE